MKAYIDIGSNSLGGYNKLVPELGIDNTWLRVFCEPNPECWDCIRSQIGTKDPNVIFIEAAISGSNGEAELMTRNDMKGDSAATIMGLKFITDSIGSVNQEKPAYVKYKVPKVSLNNVLDGLEADEFYIKMDCEGAEYSILPSLKALHLCRIKKLYVEFHAHDDKMRSKVEWLKDMYSKLNIQILNWD